MEELKQKKPADMELVLFWINHIEQPCKDEQGNTPTRYVYLAKARELLPKLTNPDAKLMLEEVIKKYE